MNETFAILAGIGLAAACGFRIFLPLFIASMAVRAGIDGVAGFELASLLGEDLAWVGSTPAIITLGVATVLEIGGYYVPWLDNALDTIATPAALVAGTLVAFALFPGGNQAIDWALAAIAGGGTAGLIQSGSVALRGASTATTGGLGNFAVATLELLGSLLGSVLTIFLPMLAGGLALLLAFFVLVKVAKRLARRRAEA
ncbi:DUF4126 domain-containing protein [Haloferula sp. A504]|uniref:DUF4126 domain-containing protein n=1 Tax=Haloferula sp. A504 TaxID=3373601 RepID=UPI0031C70CD5|nr:DUF4126 domain-containing protein [Verrucomicrobiaceae bacterium E54]